MAKPLSYPALFPLSRRLGLLSRMYYGALLKKFEKLGLDRHYSVLLILDDTAGKCSQQYISDLLAIDKATIVRMIDHLSEKGFIRRVNDPADRRAYHLQLTSRGERIMPSIKKGIAELNERALKRFSKKEKKYFYEALDKIYDNIVNEPSHEVVLKVDKINGIKRSLYKKKNGK